MTSSSSLCAFSLSLSPFSVFLSLSLLKNACATVYRVCSEWHALNCDFLFVSILRQDLDILAQTVLKIEVPLFSLHKCWEYTEFYALQRISLPFYPVYFSKHPLS